MPAPPGRENPPRVRGYPFPELSSHITPNLQFFLRSHLNYPRLEPNGYELTVEGLVERPLKLTLQELRALPSEARKVTLECSENPPGAGLVSTARWRGVPLRILLEKAGIRPGAREVVLEGADFGFDEYEKVPLNYARSISLEAALAPGTLVAWEMNGEALPWEHGFPARLVVAGHYGTSSVKWLTQIRAIDHQFKGFYMIKRNFTARRIPGNAEYEIHPEIEMKVKSQFARPLNGEQLSSPAVVVAGAAWSKGTITRVEVSTDSGRNWQEARLLDPAEPAVWVRWQHLWKPEQDGKHVLVCRAFDEAGGEQPEGPDNSVINRYGNNWYHQVEVMVRSG